MVTADPGRAPGPDTPPANAAAPRTPPGAVVVLIPTLNEARHIASVLQQLLQGDSYAQGCRIVVADGGSSDATRAIVTELAARWPNVALHDNPGRTQAHAMNSLLAADGPAAGAEIAIRCDAHAEYPPGFIAALVAALEARPEAASVVIPMDARHAGNCFRRGLARVADTKLGAGGSPHRGGVRSGWVEHGHHAAFRLAMFRALGGYDTSFRANEDAEYDRRVLQAGGRIWLEAGIRIGYYPRDTLRGLWRQYYHYGLGRARNCAKHRTRLAARQAIPLVHVILLGLSVVLMPFGLLGWIWPLAYGALVCGAGVMLALRHREICALWAAPALAAMHTAWGIGFLVGWRRGA